MLSKTKVKYIRSLELKKFRNENNVFVAEGNKLVADMLPAFECELLIAKPSWMATQGDIPAKELLVAEKDDIRKASFLKNPQDVLAIFKRPNWDITEITPEKELVLALDGIHVLRTDGHRRIRTPYNVSALPHRSYQRPGKIFPNRTDPSEPPAHFWGSPD